MNYEFNLDITPGGMPPILHMSQYDTDRTYTAHLRNGSDIVTLESGATAQVKGVNGKNVAFVIDATVIHPVGAGTTDVQFQLTAASTDQFGKIAVTLEIDNDGETLSPLAMIFDIQRAGITNEQAAASPEFQTAIEEAVDKALGDSVVFSYAAKSEYLDILEKMAYTDKNGRAAYNSLKAELMPPGIVQSITATFTQGATVVYNTDALDDLKPMLTVTAVYDSSTSLEVDGYTLSGELTVGTSTITVTYYGKTATFNVTVASSAVPIGTPNVVNNILTPGSSGMIRSMEAFSPGSSPWKMQIGFTPGSSVSGYQDYMGSVASDGTSERGVMLESFYYPTPGRGAIGGYLSGNGTSWNINQAGAGSLEQTITPNTESIVEFEFTGEVYRIRISTDGGQTWSDYSQISSTTPIKGGYYLGVGLKRNGYFLGTIDLTKIKVWIDDVLWWKVI